MPRHHSHHKQNMTPRNLFKLAVRILGLVFLYQGLMIIPQLFAVIFDHVINSFMMIPMIVWPMVVAFCLLGFAPKITDFFYPRSED